MLFYGPSGAGKKTRIMCLLREIFGASVERVKMEHRPFKTPSGKVRAREGRPSGRWWETDEGRGRAHPSSPIPPLNPVAPHPHRPPPTRPRPRRSSR
jgi:hypothetical protein